MIKKFKNWFLCKIGLHGFTNTEDVDRRKCSYCGKNFGGYITEPAAARVKKGISIKDVRIEKTGLTTTVVDSEGIVWFERVINGKMSRIRRDDFMKQQEELTERLTREDLIPPGFERSRYE